MGWVNRVVNGLDCARCPGIVQKVPVLVAPANLAPEIALSTARSVSREPRSTAVAMSPTISGRRDGVNHGGRAGEVRTWVLISGG